VLGCPLCSLWSVGDMTEAGRDSAESFTNLEVAMRLGLAIRIDAGRGGYDECTGSKRVGTSAW
jgi:hypothetical protein